MAMSPDRADRERDKFKQGTGGETLVQVTGVSTDPVPSSISTAGTTDHFNGSVGLTPVNVPTSAGNNITRILIANLSEKKGEDLSVSFDGGTTTTTIFASEAFTWEPKGLAQVELNSNVVTGVSYEIVVNRE